MDYRCPLCGAQKGVSVRLLFDSGSYKGAYCEGEVIGVTSGGDGCLIRYRRERTNCPSIFKVGKIGTLSCPSKKKVTASTTVTLSVSHQLELFGGGNDGAT